MSDTPVNSTAFNDSVFDSELASQQADRVPSSATAASPSQPTTATPDTQQNPAFDDSIFDPEIKDELLQSKYGGIGSQIVAGLEGIGQGVAGPLAPAIERMVGVPSEDILGRAEANPITHGAGEIGGLIAGSAADFGLSALMTGAGKAAEAAAGLGKLGSSVVRHAVENAVFQGGDEVSKLILQDPNQSAETAVADMGLSTLVGGAFGTVSPLWKATLGKDTHGILTKIANKLGGIESVIPNNVEDQIAQSGLDIAPELKAQISGDPQLRQWADTLAQTDTNASGKQLQETFKNLQKQAGDALISSLGKAPEDADVLGMGKLSEAEYGKRLGNAIADQYEKQISPLSATFDDLKSKFKDIELTPDQKLPDGTFKSGAMSDAAASITKLAQDQGWMSSPSSDIMREVNRVLKELPLQKNLKNLSDYISQVGSNTSSDITNGPLRRAGQMMASVLRDTESDAIEQALGKEAGPEAISVYNKVKADYRGQALLKDALDSRLHTGASTAGYAKALREMANTDGESLLRRLSGKGDADVLGVLAKNYPDAANVLKDYHVTDIVNSAANKAKDGFRVDNGVLLRSFDKLSPELKNFITSAEQQQKLNSISSVMDMFKSGNFNFSNTARTVDKLLDKFPGTAVAGAGMLTGHNPIVSGIIGTLVKPVAKDAPDAIKLALLKFFGSDTKVNASGFKSAVEFIHATRKGESALARGVKNIFKAGSEVLPPHLIPSDKDKQRLDKELKNLQDKPQDMFNVAGDTGHYLPEHAIALARTAGNAASFINSRRPDSVPNNPLDTKPVINSADKAQYDRMLGIAQQPLMILQHIANGVLTPQDVQVQKTLYPGLYNRMSQKLTNEMVNVVSKGGSVPYKTRQSLSLYLGQGLDYTFTPQGILNAQPKPPSAQQQTATTPASNPKRSMSPLNKMSSPYMTPLQDREMSRLQKKH